MLQPFGSPGGQVGTGKALTFASIDSEWLLLCVEAMAPARTSARENTGTNIFIGMPFGV